MNLVTLQPRATITTNISESASLFTKQSKLTTFQSHLQDHLNSSSIWISCRLRFAVPKHASILLERTIWTVQAAVRLKCAWRSCMCASMPSNWLSVYRLEHSLLFTNLQLRRQQHSSISRPKSAHSLFLSINAPNNQIRSDALGSHVNTHQPLDYRVGGAVCASSRLFVCANLRATQTQFGRIKASNVIWGEDDVKFVIF